MLLGHTPRLLWSRQQARCSSYFCSKYHNKTQTRQLIWVHAAISPVVSSAAAIGQAAAVANSKSAHLHTARVLFVGGLPGTEHPDEIHKQLAALCAQWQPTHIEVAKFKKEAEKSKFSAGWKHKGHALVAFTSEQSLVAAAAAVRCFMPWADTVAVGPAQKVPTHWPPELTMMPEELAEQQQQQAAAEVRRSHNKRQRVRQQQRVIDSVEMLLTALPPPAGCHVLQQYKPLVGQQLKQYLTAQQQYNVLPGQQSSSISTSSTIDMQLQQRMSTQGQYSELPAVLPDQPDCITSGMHAIDSQQYSLVQQLLAVMPVTLRKVIRQDRLLHLLSQPQQQGLIRLEAAPSVAAVEQQLLFDWSKVPAVVDPAFGGLLADADVIRAGAGRMNLRALRKRVQVESFAMLLLQLTLPALVSNTPLHVVEFGSGSGNLLTPLAYLFPCFCFTAVDMKPHAVRLLRQRLEAAGLTNVVKVHEGTIEMYTDPADVVLALHACGAASDWSLAQAVACGAAFILSPCCIGKINKNNTAGLMYQSSSSNSSRSGSSSNGADSSSCSSSYDDSISDSSSNAAAQNWQQAAAQPAQPAQPTQEAVQHDVLQAVQNTEAWQAVQRAQLLQYPRSKWLSQHLNELAQHVLAQQQQQQLAADSPPLNKLQQAVLLPGSRAEQSREIFSLLAQAADYSHQEQHSYPDLAALAKSNVEFDRGMHMVEEGYETALVRLIQPQLTAKSDVLLGIPKLDMTPTTAAAATGAGSRGFPAQASAMGRASQAVVDGNRRLSWVWGENDGR